VDFWNVFLCSLFREKKMTAERMFDMVRRKEVDLSIPETTDSEEEPSDLPKRSKGYYRYQLAGVVVHSGSTESGHYYSFIRERVCDKDGSSPSSTSSPLPAPAADAPSSMRFRPASTSTWCCFNDSTVEYFDPKNIPDRCFGGMEAKREYDSQTQSWKV
jgi:ubiquitin carboxyl-terminal hydrolase 34